MAGRNFGIIWICKIPWPNCIVHNVQDFGWGPHSSWPLRWCNTWLCLTAAMWWESRCTLSFCCSDESNLLCGAGQSFGVAKALHANELWNLSSVPLPCSSNDYPDCQLGATICSDLPFPHLPTLCCLHSLGIKPCHYDRCCTGQHGYTHNASSLCKHWALTANASDGSRYSS